MSILDNNLLEITPPNSQIIANTLKGITIQTFLNLADRFNNGSKMFWSNPNASPSEIAEALGTDAREVFELHYALGQLIGSIKPESIQTGLSVIGQFTMNEDGTVTVIEPTPDPA